MQERYSPWSMDEKEEMFLKNTRISLAGSIFISRKCVHTLLQNTTIRACLFLLPALLVGSTLALLALACRNASFGRCVLQGSLSSRLLGGIPSSSQPPSFLLVSIFCILNGTNLDMSHFCC
mmetsp:Transcript_8295/g.15045  ORF Transcript_8295/g.15045 Transcript_8295/m.15045 type:complete len:121 (+) Transcript_8295:650-1012(+)